MAPTRRPVLLILSLLAVMPFSMARICQRMLLLALVFTSECHAQPQPHAQHRVGPAPVHLPGRLTYPISRDQYTQLPLWSRPHLYRWETRHHFDQYVGSFPNDEILAHLASQGVGLISPLACSNPCTYTDVFTGSKFFHDDIFSAVCALLAAFVVARVVGVLRGGASPYYAAVFERARRRITDGFAGVLANVRHTASSATKGTLAVAALPSRAPATHKTRPRSAGVTRPPAAVPERASRRRPNAASRSHGAPIAVASRTAHAGANAGLALQSPMPPPRCLSPVRWQRPSRPRRRRRAADRRLLTAIGGTLAGVDVEDVAPSEEASTSGVHPSSPPVPSLSSASSVDDDEGDGDTMASLFEVWANALERARGGLSSPSTRTSRSASSRASASRASDGERSTSPRPRPREQFPSFEYLDYQLRRAIVLSDCEGPVDVDCPLGVDLPDRTECDTLSTDIAGSARTGASHLTRADRHAAERSGYSVTEVSDAPPVAAYTESAVLGPILTPRGDSVASPTDACLPRCSTDDSRPRNSSTETCADTGAGDLSATEVQIRPASLTEARAPSTLAMLPSSVSTPIATPNGDLAAAASESGSPGVIESMLLPSSSNDAMIAYGRCSVMESRNDSVVESPLDETAAMDGELLVPLTLDVAGPAAKVSAESSLLLLSDAAREIGLGAVPPQPQLALSLPTTACLPAADNMPPLAQAMLMPYLPAADVRQLAPLPPPILLPFAAAHQVAPPPPILLPAVAPLSHFGDFAPRAGAAGQDRPLGHVSPVPISHAPPVPASSRQLSLPAVAPHSSAIVAELLGELSSTPSRSCVVPYRGDRVSSPRPRLGRIPNLIAAGERARQISETQLPSLNLSGLVGESELIIPSSSSEPQNATDADRAAGACGGLDVLSSTALALSCERAPNVSTLFTEPRLGAEAVPPEHLSVDTQADSQRSSRRKRKSRSFLSGASHSAVDESTACSASSSAGSKSSHAHRAFGVKSAAAPRRASSERPPMATRRSTLSAASSCVPPRRSCKRKPCPVSSGTSEMAVAKPSYAHLAFGVESPAAPRRASSERPPKMTRAGAPSAATSCATPRKSCKRKPCSVSSETSELAVATPSYAHRAFGVESPAIPRRASFERPVKATRRSALSDTPINPTSRKSCKRKSCSVVSGARAPLADDTHSLSDSTHVFESARTHATRTSDVKLADRASKAPRFATAPVVAAAVRVASASGASNSCPSQFSMDVEEQPQPRRSVSNKRKSVCFSSEAPSVVSYDVTPSDCERPSKSSRVGLSALPSRSIGATSSVERALLQGDTSSVAQTSSRVTSFSQSASHKRRHDSRFDLPAATGSSFDDECGRPFSRRKRSHSVSCSAHDVGAAASAAESISDADDELKENGTTEMDAAASEANSIRVGSGSGRMLYPTVFTTRADTASTKCLAVLRALSECTALVTRDALADFAPTRAAFSEGGDSNARSIARVLQFLSGSAPELSVLACERTTSSSRASTSTGEGVGKYLSVEGRLLSPSIDALSADFAMSETPADYFVKVMDAFQEFGERRSRSRSNQDLFDFEEMRTVPQAREHLADLRRACVASRTFGWLWQLNRTCSSGACGSSRESRYHFAPQIQMHVSCEEPCEGGGQRRLNSLAEGLASNFEAYAEIASRCPACREGCAATSVMTGLPPYFVVTLPEHSHEFTYPIDGLDLGRFSSDSDKSLYDLVAVIFEEDAAETGDEEKSTYESEREWVTAVRHMNVGDGAAALTAAALSVAAAAPTDAAVSSGATVSLPVDTASSGSKARSGIRRSSFFVRYEHGDEPRRLSRVRDIVTPDARLLVYEQRR